jgi:integrase
MSAGHIQRRGKSSWRLKFEGERAPETGRRKTQYVTFRGTKAKAKLKLAELVAAVGGGLYVEPTKLTVGDHVLARIDQWEASEAISARTAQRYRQLANGQIIPHIGSRLVQKLSTLDIETWHATLRASGRSQGNGGVSPRTVVHAHRTLSHALDDAVRHGVVPRNVAKLQAPPKVQVGEMAILDPVGIAKLIADLRGHLMYPTAIVALFTGMRLGEILALRWLNVDLDAKLIRVPGSARGDQGARAPFQVPEIEGWAA